MSSSPTQTKIMTCMVTITTATKIDRVGEHFPQTTMSEVVPEEAIVEETKEDTIKEVPTVIVTNDGEIECNTDLLEVLSSHFDYFSQQSWTEKKYTIPFSKESVERLIEAVTDEEPPLYPSADTPLHDFLLTKNINALLIKYRAEKDDEPTMHDIGQAYVNLGVEWELPDGIVTYFSEQQCAYLSMKEVDENYWIPSVQDEGIDHWHSFLLRVYNKYDCEIEKEVSNLALLADYPKIDSTRLRSYIFKKVRTLIDERVRRELAPRITVELAIMLRGDSQFLRLPWGIKIGSFDSLVFASRKYWESKGYKLVPKQEEKRSTGWKKRRSDCGCGNRTPSTSSDESSDSSSSSGGCHSRRYCRG